MLASTVTVDLFGDPRDDFYLKGATCLVGSISGGKVPKLLATIARRQQEPRLVTTTTEKREVPGVAPRLFLGGGWIYCGTCCSN